MGVYKEGKNWKVQVYYKDWQGNRKRKQKRGFRTKGEAKEWERDFLQQQSQGVDIEFGNFLEIYYKDMDVRLRENTMYTKRYIIDLKIKPYFEKKILSEITVADVRAWGNIGNNYLKGLFALAFQGFFMMVCVGIYAVLVNAMTISSDLHAAMFSVAAYTVILAFSLFKTGSLSKSIFNAH